MIDSKADWHVRSGKFHASTFPNNCLTLLPLNRLVSVTDDLVIRRLAAAAKLLIREGAYQQTARTLGRPAWASASQLQTP